ncbi:MAG TPA: hypothetical protein PKJ85_11385, partial [Nitrosomonas nitrosa]|nr:hypothetical protein [Nitrosomonas nitrosa]
NQHFSRALDVSVFFYPPEKNVTLTYPDTNEPIAFDFIKRSVVSFQKIQECTRSAVRDGSTAEKADRPDFLFLFVR